MSLELGSFCYCVFTAGFFLLMCPGSESFLLMCPGSWVLSAHVSWELGSFCSSLLGAGFFLLLCPWSCVLSAHVSWERVLSAHVSWERVLSAHVSLELGSFCLCVLGSDPCHVLRISRMSLLSRITAFMYPSSKVAPEVDVISTTSSHIQISSPD